MLTMQPVEKYADGYDVLEPAPQNRTLHQRISVADRSLKDKVMHAFNLAKSAGQELNVTFFGASRLTQ